MRLVHIAWEHVNLSEPNQVPSPNELEEMRITPRDFSIIMQDPRVHEILDDMDIAVEDRLDLFEILDADGSGDLEVCELLHGLRKLRGDARRSDVIANGLIIRALQEEFEA